MTSPRTAILYDVRVFGPACRSVNTLDLTLTGSSNGANVHTSQCARDTASPRVRSIIRLFARGFVRRSTFRESSGTARACETVESESRAGATARARAEPQRGAARAAAEGADPCLVPTSHTACSRLATPLHMPRPTPRPLYSHCVRASAGTSAALLHVSSNVLGFLACAGLDAGASALQVVVSHMLPRGRACTTPRNGAPETARLCLWITTTQPVHSQTPVTRAPPAASSWMNSSISDEPLKPLAHSTYEYREVVACVQRVDEPG